MQKLHNSLRIRWCLIIILCFFASNVFPLSKKNVLSPAHYFFIPESLYYQISVATGITSIGATTNLGLTDAIVNRYVANRKSKLLVFFGAGLGYRFRSIHPVSMALGAAFYYITWGRYGGIVHPAFSLNPAFDTLNYSYHLSSALLWLEQYWMFGRGHWRPYLFLGFGAAWNNTFDYREVPTNPNGSAAPIAVAFKSKVQPYFSYGIGVGINYLLSNNKTRISVGYRYINLGKGRLGMTPLQTTSERLSTGRLYAHLIILSLFLK